VARCVFIIAVNSWTSDVVISKSLPSAHAALAAMNALKQQQQQQNCQQHSTAMRVRTK
jgi:hypothetical protein